MAAETKAKSPVTVTKEPTHWVVLHNMVGRFEKGKVIPNIQWPKGTSFEDLQRLGAIRPAEAGEVEEGSVDVDPEASKEAKAQEIAVLKTQIDLLEKENAALKDAGRQTQLQSQAQGSALQQTEGLKTVIKKKDEAIKDLTQRLADTEAVRVSLAGQVDDLQKQLEAATKPAVQPTGGDKK
jgi:hypothetical protein